MRISVGQLTKIIKEEVSRVIEARAKPQDDVAASIDALVSFFSSPKSAGGVAQIQGHIDSLLNQDYLTDAQAEDLLDIASSKKISAEDKSFALTDLDVAKKRYENRKKSAAARAADPAVEAEKIRGELMDYTMDATVEAGFTGIDFPEKPRLGGLNMADLTSRIGRKPTKEDLAVLDQVWAEVRAKYGPKTRR